ncbi:MAG: hypothetical protein ABI821_04165 [Pseudomonadota bacterium]
MSDQLVRAKRDAGEITQMESDKRTAEYIARADERYQTTTEYRGLAFIEPVEGGSRQYRLLGHTEAKCFENRYLMLLGTLLAFGGV